MRNEISRLDLATWGGFIIFALSSVITPVCLPEITKTIPASLSESGGIETARNTVVLVILLLASLLSRLWTKKIFLAQGQYLIAFGLLLVSFSQSYFMLVFSLMIMGLGNGLSEAFLNPLIAEMHKENSGKFLNFSNAFYPLGVMASAIILGELLTLGYSWRTLFRFAAIAAFILAVFFNILNSPKSEPVKNSSWENYKQILTKRGFWLFASAMFLGGGIESALTFWSRSYVEVYLSDVPRTGAIAVMIFAASMTAGRLLAAYFSAKFTLKNIIISSTILGAGIGLMLPLTSSLIGFYSLVALAGLAAACFWPTILAEAKSCLSVDTTTLFILLACSGVVGFGITPWFIGIIGDNSSLRTSFILVPLFFILLLILFLLEKWFINSRIKLKN